MNAAVSAVPEPAATVSAPPPIEPSALDAAPAAAGFTTAGANDTVLPHCFGNFIRRTAASAVFSPFSLSASLSSTSTSGFPIPKFRPSSEDFVSSILSPASLGMISADVAIALEPDPDDDIVQVRDKRKGPRNEYVPRAPQQRGDISKSQMADMLVSNDHLDTSSRHGKSFRPVYRIPGTMFEDVHRWIDQNREALGFQKYDFDCCGKPAVPLKLKTLASFFQLSTGLLSKGMAHQIGCDEETMRVFFLRFIRSVSTEQGPKWIKLPSTAEQLAEHVASYDYPGGLPGCMGSIDCTHLGWCRARTSVKSW